MLLNFDYALVNNDYGGAYGSAIAILNPATEHWDVVAAQRRHAIKKQFLSSQHTLARRVVQL